MTITDLIPDVITYLVAQCQQNPVLGAANPPAQVFDGPTGPGEPLTQPVRVWIGYDAKTGADDAGRAVQKFAYMGTSGGRREQEGVITCTAEAWSGEPDVGNVRATCKAAVGAVEIMLRGSPSTGIGPGDSTMGGLVQWSQVTDTAWTQTKDENGASAMCVFTVAFTAYLNP